MAQDTVVCGHVEPGFEPVAEAFAANFAERGELGAAFAATLDGRPVVDLWGGVADAATGRPWLEDTMQVIFSGTKGVTALCMAMLLDRGSLKLDDPVSVHWPEFAAHGKEAITVADVATHCSRLPGVRAPVGEQELLDPGRMAALLAEQEPESDPRAQFIYHALTYGWLCGELMRRVDGRSLGRFLAEEVAAPLDLELWLGLPPELEPRVAALSYGPNWGQSPPARRDPFPGDDLWASIYENPPLFIAPELNWNLPAWHAAEIAGANAIGTARSIARMYGALACGGECDGVRLLSAQTLKLVATPLASGVEPHYGVPMVIGVGFELQTEHAQFGPVEQAFGFTGAGGSVHGAWPEERVGFSYAMNELRDDLSGDGRPAALLAALHACVTAV